jgi:hypothetical protein
MLLLTLELAVLGNWLELARLLLDAFGVRLRLLSAPVCLRLRLLLARMSSRNLLESFSIFRLLEC